MNFIMNNGPITVTNKKINLKMLEEFSKMQQKNTVFLELMILTLEIILELDTFNLLQVVKNY